MCLLALHGGVAHTFHYCVDVMTNQKLKDEFHREVLSLCDVTMEETSYNPTGFRGKVQRVGAFSAATDILNSASDNWGGFTELILQQRIDLSLEVLVLHERWRKLFNNEQLMTAMRRLRAVNYPNIPDLLESNDKSLINERIERRMYTTNCVVRDSNLAKKVKELYQFKCQVCGIVLIAGDIKYAEAAHIRPVGEPHNGNDTIRNLMCLCPNHHKLFDMGGFFVENNFEIPLLNKSLTVHEDHPIDTVQFEYHRNWFNESS